MSAFTTAYTNLSNAFTQALGEIEAGVPSGTLTTVQSQAIAILPDAASVAAANDLITNFTTAPVVPTLGAAPANTGTGTLAPVNGTAPLITSSTTTSFSQSGSNSFSVTTTGTPVPTITETGGLPHGGVSFVDNGNGTATLSGIPGAGSLGTHPLVIAADNGVAPAASQTLTLTVTP